MDEPDRVARQLLESAATLANAVNARAIIVAVDGLPELDVVPPRTLLVARNDKERAAAERFAGSAQGCIDVPDVELDRMGQVKLAAIIGVADGVIALNDDLVFLAGPHGGLVDTLVALRLGSEYELLDTADQPAVGRSIRRAVFHRALSLALHLGHHGREGRRTGMLLVVGDHQAVLEKSVQMILNPFKGYPESERNILDDAMSETVKEFSSLDGAFIIRGDGVIETAGARLQAGLSEGLPSGLGARHAAAAGITAYTQAIAITVSESDGTVRVWRGGKMVAAFESA